MNQTLDKINLAVLIHALLNIALLVYVLPILTLLIFVPNDPLVYDLTPLNILCSGADLLSSAGVAMSPTSFNQYIYIYV